MLHTLEVDIFLEVGVDESSVKNILKNWSVDCQKFFLTYAAFGLISADSSELKKKKLKLLRCIHFNTCRNRDELPAETSLTDGILSQTVCFLHEDGGCSGDQSSLHHGLGPCTSLKANQ